MSTTIEITQPTAATSVEVAIATPGPKGDPSAGAYATIIDTSDQVLASVTAAQAVALGTSVEADGITLVNGKVVFSAAGVYSITWSLQFANADNNTIHATSVWFVLNGQAVADSNSRFDVPGAHSGKNGHLVGAVNTVMTCSAGDELQIFWSGDSTLVTINTIPAATNPVHPRAPGVILTVAQIR